MSNKLIIGIDLDETIYGYPDFFREFISAMRLTGHKIFCTSNHSLEVWHNSDRKRLIDLGIDPDLIDPGLLNKFSNVHGAERKGRMADVCDYVFDDHADVFQKYTKTPVFKVPVLDDYKVLKP